MRYEYALKSADGLVATGGSNKPLLLHTVSVSPNTASPTAGLLTIYDGTSEAGTPIYREWVLATAPGHTIRLDVLCRSGIYVGFDSTLANVNVTVAYQ